MTGASGFLGSRTVAILSEQGCFVHALVRNTSRCDHLDLPNVTIFHGDIAEAESLISAFIGAEFVIHTAADTSGSEAGRRITIHGTKNILALCKQFQVRKLVYISTCNVYAVADYTKDQTVTEKSALERFPEKRGPYTHAKLEAEQLVTQAMDNGSVPIVCLRPGTIYGPGGNIYTPMMGFAMGNKFFAVIGDGRFVLPLVYVDNLVEAIVAAMKMNPGTNQIYNVVDPVEVTKRDFMERVVKKLYPDSRAVCIPVGILKIIVYLQEIFFWAMGRKPVLSMYRLNSSQKPVRYDVSKLSDDLVWRPRVSVEAAFNKLISYEKEKANFKRR